MKGVPVTQNIAFVGRGRSRSARSVQYPYPRPHRLTDLNHPAYNHQLNSLTQPAAPPLCTSTPRAAQPCFLPAIASAPRSARSRPLGGLPAPYPSDRVHLAHLASDSHISSFPSISTYRAGPPPHKMRETLAVRPTMPASTPPPPPPPPPPPAAPSCAANLGLRAARRWWWWCWAPAPAPPPPEGCTCSVCEHSAGGASG